MLRWLTGALVMIGLWAAPAHAYTVSPFEAVPNMHWAYQSITRLENDGFFTGSPRGTFAEPRRTALTRYEFAVAAARIYQDLQPRVLVATEAGQLSKDVGAFRELFFEFRAEIAALGPDTADMERQLQVMDERLSRLSRPANQAPLLARPRTFGLRNALVRPLLEEAALTLRKDDIHLGLATSVGSALVRLDLPRPGFVGTVDRQPFESAANRADYRAQVALPFSLPVGRYLLSAFYDHDGGASDPLGIVNPYVHMGPSERLGGQVTALIANRLNLQIQASQLHPIDDEMARWLYIQGSADFRLPGGFDLQAGVERTWMDGPLTGVDLTTFKAGLARSFGKNARLEFLYRYYAPGRGLLDGSRELGNSSAITQISVRF